MKCPKCDFDNPPGSRFCAKCGTEISSVEEISPSETKPVQKQEGGLTTGSTFGGRYRIIEELGRGGMGVVYKAEDTKLRRNVALKLLPPDLTRNREAKERFIHEAQTASVLDHPNICTIHEIDENDDGQMFISMACYQGETLKKRIGHGPLDLGEIVEIALQVLRGLAKAHAKGIVHRDIKPANIMISDDGIVSIMDFGLAKLADQTRLTRTGTTVGTVAYMSPEQAQGQEVDQRADIWSFGVVLYEMITGQLPFKGGREQAMIYSILNVEPEPVAGIRTGVPAELATLVSKTLSKTLDSRYQKTADVLADLTKIGKSLNLHNMTGGDSPRGVHSSIAVLPFVTLSADPEQDYFCDGMAEEIINALTHVEDLRVVARTSSFAFKGKHLDIREIGRKLNVETVLEGSVRKAGNRLRITAQLVKADDGYHLWSERYDREMEDVFAIQDEISLAIVENLKIKLLGRQKTNLTKRHTDNIDAYTLYLKGRYFWNKRTEKGLKKGIEYFKRAIKLDPEYAVAYTGLADSYNLLSAYSIASPGESIPKAKAAATKALEIDADLAEGHECLGHVSMLYDWNWEDAQREFRRAIELNPNYATAHQRHGILLTAMGRMDEALAEIKRAQELDPLSLIINTDVGLFSFLEHRYGEAADQCRKPLEMDPNFAVAHFALGLACEQMGKHDEAAEEFQEAINLSGGNPIYISALGHARAVAGSRVEAQKILNKLIALSKRRYVSPYSIATVYAGFGEVDQTLASLDRACEERSVWLGHLHLRVDPRLDCVHSVPGFAQLLERMGFGG
jgi:serine/threonine protein kinase/tetratricopeptide (TPR) repeat protein